LSLEAEGSCKAIYNDISLGSGENETTETRFITCLTNLAPPANCSRLDNDVFQAGMGVGDRVTEGNLTVTLESFQTEEDTVQFGVFDTSEKTTSKVSNPAIQQCELFNDNDVQILVVNYTPDKQIADVSFSFADSQAYLENATLKNEDDWKDLLRDLLPFLLAGQRPELQQPSQPKPSGGGGGGGQQQPKVSPTPKVTPTPKVQGKDSPGYFEITAENCGGDRDLTCDRTITPLVPSNGVAFAVFNPSPTSVTIDITSPSGSCFEWGEFESLEDGNLNVKTGPRFTLESGEWKGMVLVFTPDGCTKYEFDGTTTTIVPETASATITFNPPAQYPDIPSASVTLTVQGGTSEYAILSAPRLTDLEFPTRGQNIEPFAVANNLVTKDAVSVGSISSSAGGNINKKGLDTGLELGTYEVEIGGQSTGFSVSLTAKSEGSEHYDIVGNPAEGGDYNSCTDVNFCIEDPGVGNVESGVTDELQGLNLDSVFHSRDAVAQAWQDLYDSEGIYPGAVSAESAAAADVITNFAQISTPTGDGQLLLLRSLSPAILAPLKVAGAGKGFAFYKLKITSDLSVQTEGPTFYGQLPFLNGPKLEWDSSTPNLVSMNKHGWGKVDKIEVKELEESKAKELFKKELSTTAPYDGVQDFKTNTETFNGGLPGKVNAETELQQKIPDPKVVGVEFKNDPKAENAIIELTEGGASAAGAKVLSFQCSGGACPLEPPAEEPASPPAAPPADEEPAAPPAETGSTQKAAVPDFDLTGAASVQGAGSTLTSEEVSSTAGDGSEKTLVITADFTPDSYVKNGTAVAKKNIGGLHSQTVEADPKCKDEKTQHVDPETGNLVTDSNKPDKFTDDTNPQEKVPDYCDKVYKVEYTRVDGNVGKLMEIVKYLLDENQKLPAECKLEWGAEAAKVTITGCLKEKGAGGSGN
ncbi:MAG: hypothetical protein V1717_01645, partial [Candidatus Micrarchaeota archaeon]